MYRNHTPKKFVFWGSRNKTVKKAQAGGTDKTSRAAKHAKPPEKRLFHAPVTLKKIVVYGLLVSSLAVFAYVGRFVYVTIIHPSAAFGDTTVMHTVSPVAQTEMPSYTEAAETSAAPSENPTPTQTLSPGELLQNQTDLSFMKDRVNILLTGIDYSEEREGRSDFRTDTILLVCVNFATGEADMLSIPRDSYADIARTDKRWKINGAYMSAGGKDGNGFACLTETVSIAIGGIPVNYYVGVEMQAVKDIVDTIGGVWYDVDYEIDMNGRHLNIGYQLLSGQSVLDYCRARKGITSGTDIDRIDRQQRLLFEVFRQLKASAKISMIPEMYNTVSSEIYTNLNIEQIAALSLFMMDLNPDTGMNRYALKGEYLDVYNARYYVLDHTYTQKVLREIFGAEAPIDIDWTYSLDYVKNEASKESLRSSIDELQRYIREDKQLNRLLTLYPGWTALNDLVAQAKSQLTNAEKTLGNGSASSVKKAVQKIESIGLQLKQFVQNTPEPAQPAPETPATA